MKYKEINYGVLIYIPSKYKLTKYLLFKPDENKHLLQEIFVGVQRVYNMNNYVEVCDETLRTYIIGEDNIENYLKKEVENLKLEISKIEELLTHMNDNCLLTKEKEKLNQEIKNIRNKEVTVDREKVIAQLEKAIRRYEKKEKRLIAENTETTKFDLKNTKENLKKVVEQLVYVSSKN